ncbi:hypothetical protein F4777DRAFT_304995 [Nemania sp. FL0916]|nr:hypothetical protein F4777DRAFT_304995 [Nemania sp. FL0916]
MPQEFDPAVRVRALTLHSEGYSRAAILQKTGYTLGGFKKLLAAAKKRGYQPGEGSILLSYVTNEVGRGRKPKLGKEQRQRIIEIFTTDKVSRKLSSKQLAERFNNENEWKINISEKIVQNVLKEAGYNRVKGVWL